MIGPLSSFGVVGGSLSFLLALVIGILFGFFLERGGLGNPRKLTGVFYLTDFTVPKVMFTAIVTAAIGLFFLADMHIIDMSRIWIVPTFFWPQIIGGAIFGIGFVVSGYCPGTAVAGLSSGRIDAFITLIGVGAGSLIFAVFYPFLERFYNSSLLPNSTLPQLLHTNHWLVVVLVLIMALSMFIMLERLEKQRAEITNQAQIKDENVHPQKMLTTTHNECGPYF